MKRPLHTWPHSSCVCILKPCTRSSQQKFQQASGLRSRTRKLLEIDGYWRRKSSFSSGMWPLVGCPCSSGLPYINLDTGSKKWTQQINKRVHEVGRSGRNKRSNGGERVEGRCDPNTLYTCMEFSKNERMALSLPSLTNNLK